MTHDFRVSFDTEKFDETLMRLKEIITDQTKEDVRAWCSRHVNSMYIVSDLVVLDGCVIIKLEPTVKFKKFIDEMKKKNVKP